MRGGSPARAPEGHGAVRLRGRADRAAASRGGRVDEAITPPAVTEDAWAVMRQALAGTLWSKQCYDFDVDRGCGSGAGTRASAGPAGSRNQSRFHMVNHDVVRCPTSGSTRGTPLDLAFHRHPLAMVDPFAETSST